MPGGSAIEGGGVTVPTGPAQEIVGTPYVRGASDADITTHAYGRHPDQRITVYPAQRATGSTTSPAILLLHGGYWAYRATWRTIPHVLAEQGFVVLDAGYTLSPSERWPAQFDDARRALDWTRRHAAELELDPERVVVLGSSAGGQLAALLGTHPTGRDDVRGVIALSPVLSPYDAWREGGRPTASPRQRRLRIAAEELVGCPPRRSERSCWRRWQTTGVARYASKAAAPMLLVHSSGDYVPARHSHALADLLPHTTVEVVPGSGHGSGLLATPGLMAEVVGWAKARVR